MLYTDKTEERMLPSLLDGCISFVVFVDIVHSHRIALIRSMLRTTDQLRKSTVRRRQIYCANIDTYKRRSVSFSQFELHDDIE